MVTVASALREFTAMCITRLPGDRRVYRALQRAGEKEVVIEHRERTKLCSLQHAKEQTSKYDIAKEETLLVAGKALHHRVAAG